MEDSLQHHSDDAVQCRACPELLWQMIIVIIGWDVALDDGGAPPRGHFDLLRTIGEGVERLASLSI